MLIEKTETSTVKPTSITPVFAWLIPIQDELALVEKRLREYSDEHHIILSATSEHLFSAGGKRVRPAISLLISKIFDIDKDRAISLASGVEMLHTATLVHDDMIDGSLIRRGTPTLNADWSPEISVLIGDYMFARAASLVAQTDSVPIMKLFAYTLMVILNGEINQRFSRWKINLDEYYQRIYAKTAALFVLASQAAAELGNADKKYQTALATFGHKIGIAFQIVDDILDFISTTEKLGKPTGNDLRQGLFTLPAIIFSQQNPDNIDIKAILKSQNGITADLDRLVEKIRQSPAIESSLKQAQEFALEAQKNLKILPDSLYREALYSLAQTVVDREI